MQVPQPLDRNSASFSPIPTTNLSPALPMLDSRTELAMPSVAESRSQLQPPESAGTVAWYVPASMSRLTSQRPSSNRVLSDNGAGGTAATVGSAFIPDVTPAIMLNSPDAAAPSTHRMITRALTATTATMAAGPESSRLRSGGASGGASSACGS